MRRWKAAGPAPKGVDDALWKRFRTAQDTFFGARDATNAELDREFAANAEKKEALLVEAEALVPVTDLRGRQGRLPRPRRAVGRRRQGAARPDEAARGPDARGRAGHPRHRGRPVAPLQPGGAGPGRPTRSPSWRRRCRDLEAKRQKAEAAGNAAKAKEHADAIEARQSWLDQARKALADFSG